MVWMLSDNGKVTLDAIKEFNTQSPRTVAIVGAAIIEDTLAQILSERLPRNGETKKELFKANGALGNLDAKVKVVYAMGLLSKPAFNDLTKIAEVRNKFAHRLDIADFGHAEVRPLCFELKLIEKHLFPVGPEVVNIPAGVSPTLHVEELPEKLADPRQRYFYSVMLLHAINRFIPHPDNPKPPLPRELM
jgi:hypothetical protein